MRDSKNIRLALIGYPLGHSLSPMLHAYLLESFGLHGEYQTFEIKSTDLPQALDWFKRQGFTGFNVTIPHKQTILNFLDEIHEDAGISGAANTVLIRNEKLLGFNTDGLAFTLVLKKHGVDLAHKTAVVLGAGGAACAVLHQLICAGIQEIHLCNRTLSNAEELVKRILTTAQFSNIQAAELNNPKNADAIKRAHILVNTTPLGMWPNTETTPFVFRDNSVRHLIVMDLVYNPVETTFLRMARDAGAKIVDGLDMFILQGVEAMRIWSDRDVQIDLKKLRHYLKERLRTHGQN
ncbi:shikimate dehydrogenase [candidate division KSB1 bacterium]|nr:shikimate dehydrogenase [candidate division KSB1 bacterium]NIR69846.1 shikimate dehydrogenase [candidate division KSB1 bacterium]NIS24393.1 shikimate dehydrogenase [candidate division KSB1 bacterium]NIT71329.1 shikimate dehydrogenase [candidate division KSB1 bacterium]NIU27624.1 shikimate dehydrogenase [candidate division KSB1 bacterium]